MVVKSQLDIVCLLMNDHSISHGLDHVNEPESTEATGSSYELAGNNRSQRNTLTVCSSYLVSRVFTL